MLPDWFDAEPWALLLEGGSFGVPYSYFAKLRCERDSYTFFITDLCTIWTEHADAARIKAKLKPFENFLELSTTDLLGVLPNMVLNEPVPKLLLQPSADDGLAVECHTQLGFVKFSWSFDCTVVGRKEAAQHFRSRLIIPAVHLSCDEAVGTKAITRKEWNAFCSNGPTAVSGGPSPVPSPRPLDAADAPHLPPEQVPAAPQPSATQHPAKGPSQAELELARRKRLEDLLKQKSASPDKKKKRKLM